MWDPQSAAPPCAILVPDRKDAPLAHDPGAALTDATFVVVDVETTGLWPEAGDRVCEVAVLRVAPGRAPEAFSALVNPGRSIGEGASRVNGLSDADVADAPPFAALAEALARLVDGAVLIAHNAPFDVSFLATEYAIADVRPPEPTVVCTLALSRRHLGLERNGLGAVAAALGIRPGERPHRAESDVVTTYGVLVHILGRLAARGCRTVGDLVAAQGGPIPFGLPGSPELPEPLGSAVRDRRPVMIRYLDQRDRVSERVVSPLRAHGGNLVAFCHLRDAERTFRIDRIVAAWWP